MKPLIFIGIGLLLSSCYGFDITNLDRADLYTSSIEISPLSIYEVWTHEVEKEVEGYTIYNLVGKSIYESIVWFTFPEEAAKINLLGTWVPYPYNHIYLAPYCLEDEILVKHEILHAVLGGDKNHTHPLFQKYKIPPCWDVDIVFNYYGW